MNREEIQARIQELEAEQRVCEAIWNQEEAWDDAMMWLRDVNDAIDLVLRSLDRNPSAVFRDYPGIVESISIETPVVAAYMQQAANHQEAWEVWQDAVFSLTRAALPAVDALRTRRVVWGAQAEAARERHGEIEDELSDLDALLEQLETP